MAYGNLNDINKILQEYALDIQEGITNSAYDIATKGMNDLKNEKSTYQVRTGKYNKGWKVKKEKGNNYVKAKIHNATDYQLTHLLENGHKTRNGGTTRAFKHIKPVEEYCVKEFSKEVEEIIKKGGK